MRRVYSTDNGMMAGLVCDLLRQQGIDCSIRNQGLWSALGELPPNECWPEVWIANDRDFDRAMHIVNAATVPDTDAGPDWTCTCGERIEGQFAACWHCGSPRP
jgi:hypothetical protein